MKHTTILLDNKTDKLEWLPDMFLLTQPHSDVETKENNRKTSVYRKHGKTVDVVLPDGKPCHLIIESYLKVC